MRPLSLIKSIATPMSPTEAKQLKVLTQQERVTDYPYYSSVCFRALAEAYMVGSPPAQAGWMYRFHKGEERRAFSYGRNQDGQSGGFTAAAVAPPAGDGPMTLAETNLVKANETIGGQQVQIDGIAIFCKPAMTDGERFIQARLLAQIATNVSAQMSLNGDENTFPLGTIQQIPAAGGLVGTVNDDLSFIPVDYDKQLPSTNIGDPMPFGQNGWQTRGNYYRLPAGVIWNPSGNADSMLNVIFKVERDFTVYTGGTPERPQLRTDGGETPTYFKPTSVGVVLCVQLIAQVVGYRTTSA